MMREAESCGNGVVEGAIKTTIGVGGGDDELEFRGGRDGTEAVVDGCDVEFGGRGVRGPVFG